ncbi:serpin family protein [bacterium]|nr:serpin family protein [bacterium]
MRCLVLRPEIALILVVSGTVGYGHSVQVDAPPPPPWTDDLQAAADANNRFALDLYAKLRETPGNVFLSPYSVHTALAMTTTGTKGVTRDEMVKVLHLPADEGRVPAAGDLGRYYGHPRKEFSLSVANALWGQKGLPWRAEFLTLQKGRFGASLHEADFATNHEADRLHINKWVEDKTRDRVRELLKPGSITPQTVMVLANAIHFKGTWKTKFDPTRTRDATFHLADDTTATVPLMYVNAKARNGIVSDPVNRKLITRVLELPYTGGELSLVVILPALPDGLPAVERQLTAETLKTWIAGLRETQLGVSLPRFKQEQAFSLPEQLKALGMVRAFGAGADFTGMLDSGGISISAVQHKAFVEVNEEGTEAAAATAVTGEKSPDPIPFVADHPFLFLIRDARHGTILFLGRVEQP